MLRSCVPGARHPAKLHSGGPSCCEVGLAEITIRAGEAGRGPTCCNARVGKAPIQAGKPGETLRVAMPGLARPPSKREDRERPYVCCGAGVVEAFIQTGLAMLWNFAKTHHPTPHDKDRPITHTLTLLVDHVSNWTHVGQLHLVWSSSVHSSCEGTCK